MAKSTKAKKVAPKKVVKKKSVPKKVAELEVTAPVNKFSSKSCRKGKAGYDFKGIMVDGFVVATTGKSKEEAAAGAQSVLDWISLYQAHLRDVESARRKAYRALAAAKKAKK